ncbi:DUF3218 family protein [Pseudomonas aeruginosa]|nr:DUF3218 family protein [Pseudomonas aeruginosa]
MEAWDIPLVLHPEFVPDGDVSKSIRSTERYLLPSQLRLSCFNSKWLKTGLRRAERLQP